MCHSVNLIENISRNLYRQQNASALPAGGNNCESQTFSEAHLRQMQGDQAQGSRHGHLRKTQTQAKTGLGLIRKQQGCYFMRRAKTV
jgi:hypothetical protein